MPSTILSPRLLVSLNQLCGLDLKSWSLVYRASRDGFGAKDFHNKCDGVTKTLTVIKATSGNIFGGFTEKSWRSQIEYVQDPKAFIFSLVNKEQKPFKAMCLHNGQNAIVNDSTAGPCFGATFDGKVEDICIYSDSNANDSSYACFGYAYQHPDFKQSIDWDQTILAGTQHFQTTEIEVYSKMELF